MTGLLPWVVKAVLSAAYWFGCLYVSAGLFMGDRITRDGVAGSAEPLPFWLFALLALALHASLSLAWDRLVRPHRR